MVKRQIKQIEIETDGVCFGPSPKFNDETTQNVTIYRDGQIHVKGYRFGDQTLIRNKHLQCPASMTKKIMMDIQRIVASSYHSVLATDVGTWEMKVSYDEGNDNYFGSLIMSSEFDKVSENIRKVTGMPNLLLFNRNFEV
ncbi:hypothetical protein [Limosilactobacillus frumenti]|uniref:hypothetical protein n=1 Tax=Limosilactobacillus frumenti TaxID=104955 RepID=UPI0015ECC890|nr:hypothetical protein [Limosilactobacillus frumenti]MBA2913640.1 hypothetical protein [Limosilactobacillus frumenti]